MLGILVLFLLQFFRINFLVGSLSGSVAIFFVKLIDPFAYLESLIASKNFTIKAFIAVLPIMGVALIFGRAFCGWICPMDFLFESVSRAKNRQEKRVKISSGIGYIIAGIILIISGVLGIPFFTNYLSHLTNFFRAISSGIYLVSDLPVETLVLYFSISVISLLLVLEVFLPRLWCKMLCPVGKIYGLFNKISFLKLKFLQGECGKCNLCEKVCYMDVKMTPYLDRSFLRDTNCIYCGKCVERCETKGKLLKIGF